MYTYSKIEAGGDQREERKQSRNYMMGEGEKEGIECEPEKLK